VAAKAVNRLIMTVITAAVMLFTLLEWDLLPLRILFAVSLVTILPGYALASAIFVDTPLGIMEKVAFSCGFSLGMTSLGGLLLNYTDWGIQLTSWVVLLGGISLVANLIALARMRLGPRAAVDLKVVGVPPRLHQIALMALAVIIMSGAYLSARTDAESRQGPPSTLLWMRWTDDSQTEVVIRVENHENFPTTYRLELAALNGNIEEWPEISLSPGEEWETQIVPPQGVAESDLIRAVLYKLDDGNQVYREVFLRQATR
jgi:uncharacterized membrane protein